MTKYKIKKALKYIKRNDPIKFFGLFFQVKIIESLLELTVECGNLDDEITLQISLDNWKESFKNVVAEFGNEIDTHVIELVRHNEQLHVLFTIKEIRKEVEEFHKWLVFVSKLVDGGDISQFIDYDETGVCGGCKVFVLLFDKGHYKRSDLDTKTDVEKYKLAMSDKRQCFVYTSKEYDNQCMFRRNRLRNMYGLTLLY